MLGPYREALAGLGRDGRLFLLAVGVAGFSYMGLFLLLANLYLLRLDFDETFIGLFAATGALSAATFNMPAGVIGQRLGSRRSMVLGFAVLATGIGLLSLAALVPASWRATWLLSCCVVREMGNALYNVNSNPYLMAATAPALRGRVFAARMAVANLAAFAGSAVGGTLPLLWVRLGAGSAEDPRAYMVPLMLAALGLVPGVLALAATRPVPRGPAPPPASAQDLLREPIREQVLQAADRDRRGAVSPASPSPVVAGAGGAVPWAALLTLSLVAFLYIAGVAALVGFFNVLMDRVFAQSPARIGAVLAATQLLTVPVILWMAGSASGDGTARVVVLAALGVAAGNALEAVAGDWWLASGGYVLAMMLNGVFFAAATVYHQEHVHPDWRPLMSGAFMTACALGWALTNWTGGYVIVTWGYAALFGAAASSSLCGAVLFAVYANRGRRRGRRAAPVVSVS